MSYTPELDRAYEQLKEVCKLLGVEHKLDQFASLEDLSVYAIEFLTQNVGDHWVEEDDDEDDERESMFEEQFENEQYAQDGDFYNMEPTDDGMWSNF